MSPRPDRNPSRSLLLPSRWEDAIRVSEQAHHKESDSLKTAYYKWLLETHQEEKAGLVKEQQGDYLGAIGLYLEGGLPARAAHVSGVWGFQRAPALWHVAHA